VYAKETTRCAKGLNLLVGKKGGEETLSGSPKEVVASPDEVTGRKRISKKEKRKTGSVSSPTSKGSKKRTPARV